MHRHSRRRLSYADRQELLRLDALRERSEREERARVVRVDFEHLPEAEKQRAFELSLAALDVFGPTTELHYYRKKR